MTLGEFLVAAGAAASVLGLAIRWRRQETARTVEPWLLAASVASSLVALAVPVARPAAGVAVGVAILTWRDLDRRWEGLWLVASAGLAALTVYALGGLAIIGMAGGGAAAGFLLSWAEGRLGFDTLDRGIGRRRLRPYRHHVLVCYGPVCQARGAAAIRARLTHDPRFRLRAGVRVSLSSCLGPCADAPNCWVEPEGRIFRTVEETHIDALLSGDGLEER